MPTISVMEKGRVSTYSGSDVRVLLHADPEEIRELSKDLAEAQSAPRRKTRVREHLSDEQREAMAVEFIQGKNKVLKPKPARAASSRNRETAHT